MKQTLWITAGALLAVLALAAAALVGGIAGFIIGAVRGTADGNLVERYVGGEGDDKIALIRITGPIAREDDGGFFGVTASSRGLVALLDHVQEDATVKAVILEMDTPGGSVVASDEVHQKVQALRRARKPVISLMTEAAASGGYYIAAGTDSIVADPSTITGSIGVIVVLANIEELSKKIGIRSVVFKSGAFKDLGSPTRPITPQEAAIFQQLVSEAYGRFVDVVARGRRMDRARVLRLADGRIYTGAQAHRLGLVDRLGHLPEAVEMAKKRAGLREAQLVEYGAEGFLRSLLGFAGRRFLLWGGGPGVVYPDLRRPFSIQYLMVP